ncbi:DMT family transporter [Szabonella alba]|uniref:DMT family transporter n=1 Tax=Szabonella alba TaxID=2804194 RepID=A0A8K0VAC0_9RHOB|nr:DMT family transporter [Szabonella alba]MBL4918397.1 DMT family transporter [Szabonella alba]
MALSDNSRGILAMNVAMASFTLNDAMMKQATETVPLFQAIAIRGMLTLGALLILARMMGHMQFRVPGQDGRRLGWRTLGEIGGTITFLLALQHMPLANLSAIMQVLPLAVTLGAALFMREQVGWRRMSAILVGFAGVMLIVRPGTEGFNQWSVLALVSVGFVVLRDLATRRFSASVPSVVIAVWTAVSITLTGFAGLAFEDWGPVGSADLARLAGAAGFLVMGYLFVVMAMRVGDVALIAPFRYTALIWAIFLGWLTFGNLPDGWTLTGAGIVVATGLYTYLREHRLQRRLAASRASMTGTATPDR